MLQMTDAQWVLILWTWLVLFVVSIFFIFRYVATNHALKRAEKFIKTFVNQHDVNETLEYLAKRVATVCSRQVEIAKDFQKDSRAGTLQRNFKDLALEIEFAENSFDSKLKLASRVIEKMKLGIIVRNSYQDYLPKSSDKPKAPDKNGEDEKTKTTVEIINIHTAGVSS